jgi:uncharacterized protein YkwD
MAAAPGLFGVQPGNAENGAELRDLEKQVYRKANEARRKNQVPNLSWNDAVASESRRHAQNMSARHFFAHEDPQKGELSTRLDAAGIEWNRCAENIYQEKGLDDPAEDAIQSWLKSPGHRKNMLDPGFSETGIGIAVGRDGAIYIVQEFIKGFIAVKTKK